MILLLFWLLLPPMPTLVCTLWVAHPPTPDDLYMACPAGIALEQHLVKFRTIADGKVRCEKNATAIWAVDQACNLQASLDNYMIEIWAPPYDQDTLLCAITTYNERPLRSEIKRDCSPEALDYYDQKQAHLRLIGEVEQPVETFISLPAPEYGAGLYDQPASATELSTDESLAWLAGRLIWHGRVTPECDGFSGLDPLTLAANACGEAAARADVRAWQNQFDAEIYAAALAEGVPARLLKRVIRVESQYWPLWENRKDDEIGLAQITVNGADAYLRWYQPGYFRASPKRQAEWRQAFVDDLKCNYCAIEAAVEKERQNLVIYARILKAYRYAAADWYSALVLWNGADYAERVINGQ